MDTSPLIRFRIDREIATEAMKMATERGLELPDVMRMMLTKAVRNLDFAIDRDRDAPPAREAPRPYQAYEPRHWAPMKASIDAEAAMALLNQAIAQRTASLDDAAAETASDRERLERIRIDRDEALRRLRTFDPKDAEAVSAVLEKFGGVASMTPLGGSTE